MDHTEIPEINAQPNDGVDRDVNGHLATALFIAVVAMLVLLIYAFATAS